MTGIPWLVFIECVDEAANRGRFQPNDWLHESNACHGLPESHRSPALKRRLVGELQRKFACNDAKPPRGIHSRVAAVPSNWNWDAMSELMDHTGQFCDARAPPSHGDQRGDEHDDAQSGPAVVASIVMVWPVNRTAPRRGRRRSRASGHGLRRRSLGRAEQLQVHLPQRKCARQSERRSE